MSHKHTIFNQSISQSINQFICPETKTLDRTPMEDTTSTYSCP